MTKKSKLRLCDWSLLFLTIAIFASGIQLEINPAGATIWVWAHIVIGILFFCGIFWHIGLHKSGKKRVESKNKNRRNRHAVMGVFFLLTLLSGIIGTLAEGSPLRQKRPSPRRGPRVCGWSSTPAGRRRKPSGS